MHMIPLARTSWALYLYGRVLELGLMRLIRGSSVFDDLNDPLFETHPAGSTPRGLWSVQMSALYIFTDH